jgi:hypothetical protein
LSQRPMEQDVSPTMSTSNEEVDLISKVCEVRMLLTGTDDVPENTNTEVSPESRNGIHVSS